MGSRPSESSHESGHDQDFTETVLAAMGDKTSPRMRFVLTSLVQHLHDFSREVDLTTEEWLAGIDFMNRCGKMHSKNRDEFALLSDILGLESLVESLESHREAAAASSQKNTVCKSTSSCVLGPFWRPKAPLLSPASSICAPETREANKASAVHMTGRVLDMLGRPIQGAIIDIWHTAPNGMYEQQDPAQPDMDLRGRFSTNAKGHFDLYCLRPVAYPIPSDGPTGELLQMMDRHPFRPAHLHFIVSADGYRPLVTQLFDSEDQWLGTDSVFAVKQDLIVKYRPAEGDENARWWLQYDFVLVQKAGHL